MKILHAAAECAPYIKVGGLGDVVGSLPRELIKLGCETEVALPGYEKLKKEGLELKGEADLIVNYGGKDNKVKVSTMGDKALIVNLFENPDYLREGPYGKKKASTAATELVKDTQDERFEFFCLALNEWLKTNKFDVVHCHDKHTAFLIKLIRETEELKSVRTVLTIHNLASKGNPETGLVVGIKAADLVTTVSPQYAKEILTKEYGEGLESVLRAKSVENKLIGILNGIDTDCWNPQGDSLLDHKLQGNLTNFKSLNKERLLEGQGIDIDHGIPLFTFIGRLTKQKGLDILLPAWEKLLAESHAHLVILGSGEADYVDDLREEEFKSDERFGRPEISFFNRFDEKLAHQIYAAADFLLVPSLFEPCGLTQMVAMRYGTLPIVRDTGGLHDTVKDGQNGFVFTKYAAGDLLETLRRAMRINGERKILEMMRDSARLEDFSSGKSAKEYLEAYKRLLLG